MQLPTPAGLAEWREAADTAADAVVASHVDGDHVLLLRRWRREGAPTVVLVHGIGMGQQYFGLLREELSKQLDVIAIDNLPSLVPREASTSFSAELTPLWDNLALRRGPWAAARATFAGAVRAGAR